MHHDNYKDLIQKSEKEAEFFDKMYQDIDEEHRLQNYIVPDRFINQVLKPKLCKIDDHEYAFSLLGNLENKKLLDYGAGDGWNTICFAKANAKVWAIDISQRGVDLIKKKAQANGVAELVEAEVRNCYATNFQSDMFDIIYGGGILHHLDIVAAAQEIQRILHPHGVAVFYEPIRETKTMDIIKAIVLRITNRKPSEKTENESPLTMKRISLMKSYFKVVNCRYFNIFSSASVLTKSKNVRNILLWIDYILLKFVPGLSKLGRIVVIELKGPFNK